MGDAADKERQEREEYIRLLEAELGRRRVQRVRSRMIHGVSENRRAGRKFRAAVREWKKDH